MRVLENDPKVRRLIVASEISRLTQLDSKVALRGADDPTTIPGRHRWFPSSGGSSTGERAVTHGSFLSRC